MKMADVATGCYRDAGHTIKSDMLRSGSREATAVAAYSTLDEVVADLWAIEQRFLARQDRRAIFATLYGVVSAEMRHRVARGDFLDPAWVHRYAVAFANH